jgi:hypothetical protein
VRIQKIFKLIYFDRFDLCDFLIALRIREDRFNRVAAARRNIAKRDRIRGTGRDYGCRNDISS